MSERKVDLDALFDRDADSRLLDRRRRDELGLAPQASPVSLTPARFGAESIVDEPPSATAARPAALRLTIEARPDRALIPGAVVTVVASVHDDGDAAITDPVLRVAVPFDAEPVAGSFARDEVAIDGDALLGEGLRLGPLPAGQTIRVRFALRVLPGTAPLDLHAHVSAAGIPAVAPPALRLQRRAGHAAYDAPRPFFELEPGETDAALGAAAERPARLVDAVLDEPALPPVTAALPPPTAPRPPAPPPPAPPPRVAPPPAPVAAEPAAPPAAAYVLQRTLDPDEARALGRIFAGAVPHGLAALAVLSSLAASDGALGESLGLDAFARAIAAALPRALVAARIGRPPAPVVTAEALAALRPQGAAVQGASAAGGPRLVLRLGERELDSLRAVLGRTLDDPFLRGAQLLLGIAPRALEGVAPGVAEAARDALVSYRTVASAWLMRATVRRAIDRRFDPLTADDTALHDAGRALVTVLQGIRS